MFSTPYIWSKIFMTMCSNTILIITICTLLWGNSSIDYAVIIHNETSEWSEGAIIDIKPIQASTVNFNESLYNNGGGGEML